MGCVGFKTCYPLTASRLSIWKIPSTSGPMSARAMLLPGDLLQKVYEKISTMTATESHEVNEDPDQPPESNHILELQTLKVIDAF
ncbi:hypothetical protein Pst134EB_025143 [Puccinia striiformis f. sp. tritici]|nr:hypothetical protein Pst134EB_025143 [Puccinia striiformis f. sp. tritici]